VSVEEARPIAFSGEFHAPENGLLFSFERIHGHVMARLTRRAR